MKWRKLGMIFNADGQREWMSSHAANPIAEHLGDDQFRIYFGCRDRQNRSHIGAVDIEFRPEPRVIGLAEEPLVSPGPVGGFDDSGTSLGWLTQDGDMAYLYYLGWNLSVTVPWRNSIGVALRTGPHEPFVKHSPAPLLDRCAADPYTLSYPCVLHDEDRWQMWYGSNLSWNGPGAGSGANLTDMNHVIKYAESRDGLHWERQGVIALDLQPPHESAICRPSVVKDDGLYRMWYCYRGESYRIGYAESHDGIHWERMDHRVGIDVSANGWDSEMIEYPFVFDHKDQRYMLYNGNRFGASGLGLAMLAA